MVAEGGEGENLQNGGGGGGGGYPGFVSLQVPTSEAAVSADTHAFAICVVFVGKRCQVLGGPGPKPWGPGPQAAWRPGPQAPGVWIPPLSPVDFLQAKLRLKP